MLASFDWSEELGRALVAVVSVAVLGGAAGFLWNKASRRRELDLGAVAAFRATYGEWFVAWKGWESAHRAHPERVPDETRETLLASATSVEGRFEALTLKITTDRYLSDEEIDRLGRFRQGYQQLRESIRSDRPLPFRLQFDDDKVAAYATFKALSVDFATLLRGRGLRSGRLRAWLLRPVPVSEAQLAFIRVTSWRPEHAWEENRANGWWNSPADATVPQGAVCSWEEVRSDWSNGGARAPLAARRDQLTDP
jgi:hypothetical protein